MEEKYERSIRAIVSEQVANFAAGFKSRHIAQLNNPDGVINSKVHNVFVGALGSETQFYSALVRSLDSSLGTLVESTALEIAEKNFEVTQQVSGTLYVEQTRGIADLLQSYVTRRLTPSKTDYQNLRNLKNGAVHSKTHASDYMLKNRKTGEMHLIELKLGGDLDNKKARSEKEALLEQYCILSNGHDKEQNIQIHFATAYNRYGEGKSWKQERVKQFFAPEELMISSDFWNFLVQDNSGFKIVMEEYKSKAYLINETLKELKKAYVE
jgi:hypothetical protein